MILDLLLTSHVSRLTPHVLNHFLIYKCSIRFKLGLPALGTDKKFDFIGIAMFNLPFKFS